VADQHDVSPLTGLCGGLDERNLGLTPSGFYYMPPRTRLGNGIGYAGDGKIGGRRSERREGGG
jgi:hypothetical protein